MSKRVIVNCQQCGIEFETWQNYIIRGGGKYCSQSCSAKSRIGERNGRHNSTIIWFCKLCNKEMKVSSSNTKRKFCSMSCYHAWKSIHVRGESHPNYRKIKKHCVVCNSTFFVVPATEKQACCSKKCKDIKLIGTRQGKNNPLYKKELDKICEWCSIFFHAHAERQRFCSLDCKHQWHSMQMIRTDIERKYPSTFSYKFKKMIRERDNYTCLLCGKWGNQIHHIDYIKSNTYPENCTTLCESCHSKTHHNRDYWPEVIRRRIFDNEFTQANCCIN